MKNRLTVMASITFFGLIFFIIQAVCLFSLYPIATTSDLDNDPNHACARDCTLFPKPRTCAYEFTAEWYYSMSKACYDCPYNASDCQRPHCIAVNGVQRPVLAINRQIPGPSIQVCHGDRIRVTLRNMMDNLEGITIHWHGQHQRHSPHMDGTSMVTQCPIPYPQSFTYDFVADTPGTHLWHSHSGLQRADGLFGALIVRQGKDDEVHADLYDVDDVDHVLMMSDWTNVLAMQHMMMDLHADGPGGPDSILVNGRGTNKVFEKYGRHHMIEKEVFIVTPGLRHRFRTINTAVTNCPVIVSVQNHKLLVIASDGAAIEPITVDGVTVSGGERYDFVLHTDHSIDNYWIRFRGADGSECEGIEEKVILRYKGAPLAMPRKTSANGELRIVLNLPIVAGKSNEKSSVVNLRDAGQVDPYIVRGEPDVTHYIEVDSVYRNSPKLHHSLYYPVEEGGHTYTAKRTHMLNNISFSFPPAPLLSYSRYVPDTQFCDLDSLWREKGRDCGKEHCSCVHTIDIKLDQVVELVLVTKSLKEFEPHPLHIHGNHFYVVGYDNGDQLPLEKIKDLNDRGEIKKNLDRPPRKDTLMMAQRYAILRFKAENPGWWLFHCHIDLHLELGMAVVFHVGGENDVPPPPADMPVCVREAQQMPCANAIHNVNPLERDVNAEPPKCMTVTGNPAAKDTDTFILYIAISTGVLVSLACICLINVRRKFYSKDDKIRYRKLSSGEFEMTTMNS